MTEIIISNIENINDLAMLDDSFRKEKLMLNISKLARELNKDSKTIRNYLNRKTTSNTRKRVK